MLIENFRPGVMARLGLDAATCHDVNQGLVYCSLPGFSELDERAGVAGWEGVVMAAGGAYARQASSSIFGGVAGERPGFPSLPLASCFAAGMTALSGLRRADRARARRRTSSGSANRDPAIGRAA